MTAAPETVGYRVGTLAEIPPGEGRAFAVGADQVAVFHLRDGTVRAVSAVCSHAGGPLADGQTDSCVVVCPLHLNSFDLATGRSPSGAPPIAAYPVEVDPEGWVVVHLPAATRADYIPGCSRASLRASGLPSLGGRGGRG